MNKEIIYGDYYQDSKSKPSKVKIEVNPYSLEVVFSEDDLPVSRRWNLNQLKLSTIPGAAKIAVQREGFPETIEVDMMEFQAAVRRVDPEAPILNSIKKPANKVMQLFFGMIIFFVAIVAFFAYIGLPFIANTAVTLIPVETEIEYGKKMAEQTLLTEKVNKEKTAQINLFLKNLKYKSEYPIHITVVESDIKNAFAVPGGEVVVYTGLLNEMESYGELVGLLGHEIAHIEQRHTLKTLAKSLALYLALSVVLQDIQGIMAVLADNAAELEKLSYSRSLESEADEKGLAFVLNNHTDPKGMIDLFNHLKEGEKDGVIPEFLTTHPSLDKRIEELKERLKETKYEVRQNKALEESWKKLTLKTPVKSAK